VTSTLRVGIVNYLNSRPLAWSFLGGRVEPGIDTRFLPPSQVADQLAAGDLDVGLIPSIEVQRIPGLTILPGLCVAATREVRSVLLLSRCPIPQIERLALDENSRTSASLVRILLQEIYGVAPVCVTAAPRLADMMEQADAALIIGDPALSVDRSGFYVLDLAAEWRRLTGRPFVFAVWAIREGVDLGRWQDLFHHSLEQGRAEIEDLVQQASLEMNLSAQVLREYLTGCLSFELGPEEQEGLAEFYRRAQVHGFIDERRDVDGLGSCDPGTDSIE
jgi:chorismate dehydratase